MIPFFVALFLAVSPLISAERVIVNNTYETAVGFNASGQQVCIARGDFSSVDADDCADAIRDTGSILHNHVWKLNAQHARTCPAFSLSDMIYAASVNVARTTVVSRIDGRLIEISAVRATDGWHWKLIDAASFYVQWSKWQKIYGRTGYGMCSALSATWVSMQKQWGFTFTVRYR